MSGQDPDFPDDKTAPERRKNLSEQQIRELKLAGGVEGGMQAGSAGGPGANDEEDKEVSDDSSERTKSRKD